jgi:hypothetical protein
MYYYAVVEVSHYRLGIVGDRITHALLTSSFVNVWLGGCNLREALVKICPSICATLRLPPRSLSAALTTLRSVRTGCGFLLR